LENFSVIGMEGMVVVLDEVALAIARCIERLGSATMWKGIE
jgi:hypothetical protein